MNPRGSFCGCPCNQRPTYYSGSMLGLLIVGSSHLGLILVLIGGVWVGVVPGSMTPGERARRHGLSGLGGHA